MLSAHSIFTMLRMADHSDFSVSTAAIILVPTLALDASAIRRAVKDAGAFCPRLKGLATKKHERPKKLSSRCLGTLGRGESSLCVTLSFRRTINLECAFPKAVPVVRVANTSPASTRALTSISRSGMAAPPSQRLLIPTAPTGTSQRNAKRAESSKCLGLDSR